MTAWVLLDLVAFAGLGAFLLLGLLIPLTAIWGDFLPHFSMLWDPEILAAAKMTVLQAGLSAVIATVVGVAVALVLPRRSKVVRALLGIPFGVPAVAASAAWVACLPKILNFSLTAIVIAHVFFNAPWIALWVLRALDEVSESQAEAAGTLGASPAQVFRFVTLPAISPALSAGFSQVFSLCAMSFVLVMILGGGPPVDTLETTLFSRIRSGGLDLSGASACAIWQLAITLIPWMVFHRTRIAPRKQRRGSSRIRGASRASLFFGIGLSSIFLLPYFALFSHWKFSNIFTGDVFSSLKISFELAAATSILSVMIGLLGVWAENRSRIFAGIGSIAMVVPAGISVMVLGVGFFIAYGSYLDPFSSSIWPIVFLQTMIFIPVTFRVFQPISRRRDRNAWDAALTLGAPPSRAFHWVEWPRWGRPIFSMTMLVAGAACGEVAAVSLFYSESRVPVALLISRWLGQYRFDEALSLSLFLTVVSALLICFGFTGSPEVHHG